MQAPQLLAIAVISAAAAMLLLLATWAGLSRRHWFVRAAVCSAALIALYPIRAFEPMIWFAAAVPLTAWLSRLTWKRFRGKTHSNDGSTPRHNAAWQFRMTDFFLAILLAGVISALGAALWQEQVGLYWRVGAVVLCFVVTHHLCLLAVVSKGTTRLLAAIVLGFWLAASVALYVWQLFATEATLVIVDFAVAQPTNSFGNLSVRALVGNVLYGCFAVVVLVAFIVWNVLWLHILTDKPALPAKQWAHIVAVGATFVAIAPLLVAYVRMTIPPQVDVQTYAGPNNYDEILAATRLTPTAANAIDDTPSGARYDRLLAVLEKPGYVPFNLDRDSNHEYINSKFAEPQRIRSLAMNLGAEAENAAASENYDESARYALASVQIGNSTSRGGLYIHFLVGTAIQGIGMSGISDVREDVSDGQAAWLIRQLEHIEQSREPVEAMIAREVALSDRMYGWAHRLQLTSYWLLGREDPEPVASIVPGVEKRCAAIRRLLIADLAIRRFQSKYGRAPLDLEELTPEFMTSVPLDPFSGRPLVYAQSADGPIVYSVGHDGRDDGGRFGTFNEVMFEDGFDLDLESSIR